ncbi:MAG: hypothetical protein R3208_11975, partial [Ketobacteraceae bacterium]|nr:hypothetical protein [Ketobacteraceae bacterium]
LWAAIETQRYYAEKSSQAEKSSRDRAGTLVIAAAEDTRQKPAEQDTAESSPPPADDDLTSEYEVDEMETITFEEDSTLEAPVDLDLEEEPGDFLTVEEILSEDVDEPDTPVAEETPPEEEEFVNLNEILYGTTDEEKIQEIKAQEEGIEQPSRESLELEMQALKEKVLEINRDLFVLEEDLLFPSSTQVNVFVSFDASEYFALDGVTLKIDDRPISNHLYTRRELEALDRGAVQRLFTGNLTTGDHELVAVVTGVGPEGRDYRRAISLDFAKSSGTKYIELKIIGDDLRKQPIFQLREWE